MALSKDQLLGKLRGGETMTRGEELHLTMLLALPAILGQLSMCLMSYIDAAMVGHLDSSGPAAAIGLVSSACWLFGSFVYANSSGFTVQIAHRCGAKDFDGARRLFRYGLLFTMIFAVVLTLIGALIARPLPMWLQGPEDIWDDASGYFLIYMLFLPVFQLAIISEMSLTASGNIKVPAIVTTSMCLFDVVFNYLFIFVLGMGARGAALGTGCAELCAALTLFLYLITSSKELQQRDDFFRAVYHVTDTSLRERMRSGGIVHRAFGISWPLWIQNIVTRGAYIAATFIIAPLGTVAIAANSFAITAEGFCYMPGYGMQDAATTLVGQSLGAGRKDMARRFSRITIATGSAMMTALAVLMYAFAPQIMTMLSQDPAVIELGAQCLRIEAWAELLYGVSIVAYGCCVGAGDTLVPSIINLVTMWVIRIGLALILIPHMGLLGYWVAMATNLCISGIILALRVKGHRWIDHFDATA